MTAPKPTSGATQTRVEPPPVQIPALAVLANADAVDVASAALEDAAAVASTAAAEDVA